MNFRDHVREDTSTWPADLLSRWTDLSISANGGRWRNMSAAELELRAWIEVREERVAREPVVLNRHHLSPSTPQPLNSPWWPRQAIYVGRAPLTSPPLTESLSWRYSHLLGNRYSKEDYADALERYRFDLRGWMREDLAAASADQQRLPGGVRHHPAIDALRELTPLSALVCSCVTSPWTPVFRAQPGERLPPSVTCHCHLLVAAWRALQPRPKRDPDV